MESLNYAWNHSQTPDFQQKFKLYKKLILLIYYTSINNLIYNKDEQIHTIWSF